MDQFTQLLIRNIYTFFIDKRMIIIIRIHLFLFLHFTLMDSKDFIFSIRTQLLSQRTKGKNGAQRHEVNLILTNQHQVICQSGIHLKPVFDNRVKFWNCIRISSDWINKRKSWLSFFVHSLYHLVLWVKLFALLPESLTIVNRVNKVFQTFDSKDRQYTLSRSNELKAKNQMDFEITQFFKHCSAIHSRFEIHSKFLRVLRDLL